MGKDLFSDSVLKEAKRLYDAGWAVHWLHPKSKRPAGNGWTTGPRKSWKELEAAFRPGMNLGVRTGSASLIDGAYLTCLDVDVKDPAYKEIAYEKVREIVGGANLLSVQSGGGNGSCHFYCLTPAPFKMIVAGKEPKKWEVCVYSEGRQMVLPPSVHPVTGKPYAWNQPTPKKLLHFNSFEKFRLEEIPKTEKPKTTRETQTPAEQFQFDETLDIRWLPQIDEATRALILRGEWKGGVVEDRSAFLLPAVTGLLKAGLKESEVVSILTDPTTYLGKCAFDHAQTKSRQAAASWLYRYTVKKVFQERDPKLVFGALPKETELRGDELAQQQAEFDDDPEARGYYHLGARGALKPDYVSLLKAFEKERPFKTIADMKAVYVWNGTHYTDFTPIEIKSFAEKKFSPPPEERERSEFYAKVLANHVTRRNFFTETTEGRVNFQNGILDLNEKDAVLKPHSPEYGFRGVLPFDYDSKAKCPVFQSWLKEIMLGDLELISVLQEFMGYIVRGGEYKYHRALWLGGTGRNGKSTFIDVLKALIGGGNFSVISIRALMTDKFAGAVLDGKIANFSEETSPQELADSGPFKNLTGDGDISAQKKYGDPYSFRNRAKLIMTYNTIPDLKDLSSGMLSRPLIIPFERTFSEAEQDREIKSKLLKELSGIFNFAFEGWERLELQGGFTESVKSKTALQKVKEESCPVYQWVEDHIERQMVNFGDDVSLNRFRPAELYDVYQRQTRFAFKPIEFYRRLQNHPLMKQQFKRSNGIRFFQGILLR